MIPEKTCRPVLIDLAGGHGEDECNDISLFSLDQMAVYREKCVGGKKAGSFVAVRKRMIPRDSEKIGRGQSHHIFFAISGLVQRPS